MKCIVGPFENSPVNASLGTQIKSSFIDDTVICAINNWLLRNPNYFYKFYMETYRGLIKTVNITIEYQRRKIPNGKVVFTQLYPIRLDLEYFNKNMIFTTARSRQEHLDRKQEEIVTYLRNKHEGFQLKHVRICHVKGPFGPLEMQRVIHYESFKPLDGFIQTREELQKVICQTIPSIPNNLGYKSQELAYLDIMFQALSRITKKDTTELINYRKIFETATKEKSFASKLKGYGMEQLVMKYVNTNPINILQNISLSLSSKLNEKAVDAILRQRDEIKAAIQIKCYGEANLPKIKNVIAKECADSGLILVANKEAGLKNPLGVQISNYDVDRHTRELIELLKQGRLGEVERYTNSFIALATFNSAYFELCTSFPKNMLAALNGEITPGKAISNIVSDIATSGVSTAFSAAVARDIAKILIIPPGVTSIISLIVGYGVSLILPVLFDGSDGLVQDPPIRLIK